MRAENLDRFLSATGRGLHASAIRRMGTVADRRADVISFAAGYPATELFPLEELRAIAADVLHGDGLAIQYGPTRGHAPLLEALAEEMVKRSVAAEPPDLLVTTGLADRVLPELPALRLELVQASVVERVSVQ